MYLILLLLVSCSIANPVSKEGMAHFKCSSMEDCYTKIDELCGKNMGHIIRIGIPEDYTYIQCDKYPRSFDK